MQDLRSRLDREGRSRGSAIDAKTSTGGTGRALRSFLLSGLALAFVVGAPSDPAWAGDASDSSAAIVIAQADDCERDCEGRLEPRYQPREPEEKGWYNGDYVFGLSRSLANSTIEPAAKAPLFLFTVPLDLALLPFALIGGMFG
ncbi:MAG TPA: hypothetical protein PLW10_01680 [Myxococcota bacterium]|nr:hypothetical protein [Myxococcales bacterium]HPG24320.1 hypothetical protein [Myxococcota bacterium]